MAGTDQVRRRHPRLEFLMFVLINRNVTAVDFLGRRPCLTIRVRPPGCMSTLQTENGDTAWLC